MKVRSDFVSNSSSSSFVLWGVLFEKEDLEQKLADERVRFNENFGLYEWFDKSFDDYHDYVIGDTEVVAGIRPDKMEDDETLGQFKQKVFDKLKAAKLPVSNVEDVELISGLDSDGCIIID